jgi:hypothetical protein
MPSADLSRDEFPALAAIVNARKENMRWFLDINDLEWGVPTRRRRSSVYCRHLSIMVSRPSRAARWSISAPHSAYGEAATKELDKRIPVGLQSRVTHLTRSLVAGLGQ